MERVPGPTAGPIELGGIQFYPEKIVEVDSGQVMQLIPRNEIESLTLRHGYASAHPLLQAVLGLLLLGLGVWPLRRLWEWIHGGGVIFSAELGLVFFAVIGGSLAITALRRRFLIEVRGRQCKRLSFDRSCDAVAVTSFAKAADERFGYKIENGLARLG